MSRSVDSRVVEMKFDNRQFESGVKKSLTSLDKLRKGLNFDGSAKSIKNLSETAGKFSVDGMAEGVDKLASRFSALGIIAITALQNITNKIVDMGLELLRSVTVGPIASGFRGYEHIMERTRIIFANAGAMYGRTIDDVNDSIEVLREYAATTVFNIEGLTDALKGMTQQRMDLEPATRAIMGFANAGAYVGASAGDVDHAINVLGRSMKAGIQNLQDWDQVYSRIGSIAFVDTLLDAAVATGNLDEAMASLVRTGEINIRQLQNMNRSQGGMGVRFSGETLQLAAEMLYANEAMAEAATRIQTLTRLREQMYTVVAKGWIESWELIIGDVEQSAAILTDVSNWWTGVIKPITEARNAALSFWSENGGRDALIQGLANAFQGLFSILTPIGDAFRSIFPPMTGQMLVEMSERFRDFTERIKIGSETSDRLQRTFAGLFAVIALVGDVLGFLFGVAGRVFSLFGGPAAGGVLELTARLGDLLVRFRNFINEGQFLESGLVSIERAFIRLRETIVVVLERIRDAMDRIKTAFAGFRDVDTSGVEEFSERAERSFRPFTRVAQIFSAAFEGLVRVIEWAAPIVRRVMTAIGNVFSEVFGIIGNAFETGNFSQVLDLFNTGMFAMLILGVRRFINSLSGIVGDAQGFTAGIVGILDGVKGALNAWQQQLQSKTLLNIAIAIGILAVSLLLLSNIPSDKLQTALVGITILFVQLTAAMTIMQKQMGGLKSAKITVQIMALATAILILSVAMTKLAALDWAGIAKGVVGIGALTAILVIAANSFDKKSGKLIRGSTGLIAFAAAIFILSIATERFAGMSWGELARGLVATAVSMAALVIAMNLMPPKGRLISAGIAMIAISAAMLIMAKAVKEFAKMQWDEIARGLTAMAGALAAIVISLKLLPKGMINKAIALNILGGALIVIGIALARFGNMQWDEIARGLTAMAGALAAIVISLRLLPKGMINKAIALTIIASALIILAQVIKQMGGMGWDEIARGLTALGGSMIILAVALNLMKKAIPGAAAMLIVAPALVILAGALKIMGSMDLQEIGLALLMLAGVFVVLGVAGLVLKPLLPVIFGLSVALGLLGLALALAGGGVLALAIGLTILSAGASAAAGAIVLIGNAILSLIPIIFQRIGEGIISFANAIRLGAPALGEALVVLIREACDVLVETVPYIVQSAITLILGVLEALEGHLPELFDKVFNIVIGFINQLADRLPELIVAGANLLGALLQGIFDALREFMPDNLPGVLLSFALLVGVFALLAGAKRFAKDALVTAGIMSLVMLIITGIFIVISALDIDDVLEISLSLSAVLLAISASIAILSRIPFKLAINAVTGLAIFVGGLVALLAILGGIMQIPGMEWLINEGARAMQMVGEAIGGFVGGIIGGALAAISDSLPRIAENLSEFMTLLDPFIEGANRIDAGSLAGVRALAEIILILTAASLLDGLTGWLFGSGKDIVDFGRDIAEFGPYLKKYAKSIAGVDGDAVQASTNAAMALTELASNMERQGGAVQWLIGERQSLGDFGLTLIPFGLALKLYALSIKGVDGAAVESSTNAAMSLTELASNLERQGGAVRWFIGERQSLADFGQTLPPFGRSLKLYALSIKGVDGAAVESSANAAMALTELASNMERQDGAVQWFIGERESLADFGRTLPPFGRSLKLYADSVAGIDGGAVTASANAAMSLAELAANLENQGGAISWFTGSQQSLGDFGREVATLGQWVWTYYTFIRPINPSQITGVANSVMQLVSMAERITNANISGLGSFAQDLAAQGDMGIDGFITAFTNATPRVQTVIETVVTTVITTISNGQFRVVNQVTMLVTEMTNAMRRRLPDFTTITTTIITNIQNTIANSRHTIVTQVTTMVDGMLGAYRNRVPEFTTVTIAIITNIQNGISNNRHLAVNQVNILGGSMVTALSGHTSAFSGVANAFVDGFINRLKTRHLCISAAGAAAGQVALNAMRDALNTGSPSRETAEIGDDYVDGFVNKLYEALPKIDKAGDAVGKTALDSLSDAIIYISDIFSIDLDMAPVIRPVIDLTDFNEGTRTIQESFNKAQSISFDASRMKARSVSGVNADKAIVNETAQSNKGNIYNFEQHNHSPKALSDLEIYRQTKNLFAQTRELVENA